MRANLGTVGGLDASADTAWRVWPWRALPVRDGIAWKLQING
jgi:hypothetical protein